MSENPIPKSIHQALEQFEYIELDELPRDTMMERIDRKFITSLSEIDPFLNGLEKHYRIVKAAGSVIAPYRSLYLDTVGFKYFNRHRRGFSNRIKVRFRTYPKTETTFLEIKRKNNKGRTAKTRISLNKAGVPLNNESLAFLKDFLPVQEVEHLRESVEVNYDRLGFIAREGDERFSVDFELNASFEKKSVHFGDVAIIEVKQDQYKNSPVIKQLRKKGIHEESMSKYCLALSLLKSGLNWNIFKPTLHRIRKIEKETVYEN